MGGRKDVTGEPARIPRTPVRRRPRPSGPPLPPDVKEAAVQALVRMVRAELAPAPGPQQLPAPDLLSLYNDYGTTIQGGGHGEESGTPTKRGTEDPPPGHEDD